MHWCIWYSANTLSMFMRDPYISLPTKMSIKNIQFKLYVSLKMIRWLRGYFVGPQVLISQTLLFLKSIFFWFNKQIRLLFYSLIRSNWTTCWTWKIVRKCLTFGNGQACVAFVRVYISYIQKEGILHALTRGWLWWYFHSPIVSLQ